MAAAIPIPILPHFEGPTNDRHVGRFWEKVSRGAPDECWDWQASRTTSGYGRFKMARYVTLHANRIAYALTHGTDPGEHMVLHSCDRPQCCNPAHLRLGTAQDNADDKVERGRCRSGEQAGASNGAAKLSEADLALIIQRLEAGWNNQQIARDLPVGHALVSRIRRGRSWAREARRLGWNPTPKHDHLRPDSRKLNPLPSTTPAGAVG